MILLKRFVSILNGRSFRARFAHTSAQLSMQECYLWLEAYAEFMELNVWTSTRLIGADYDADARTWRARLRTTDGDEKAITAAHLVMATGSVAGAPVVPTLPGLADFTGDVLHSSAFTTGRAYAGRRAIVIGTGNSGHDVAQDLHGNGAAEVTIVQRGSTCVVSLVPSGTMVYALYKEGPADDIDLITAAIPYPVIRDSYQWLTKKTCDIDRELLDGPVDDGFPLCPAPPQVGDDEVVLAGEIPVQQVLAATALVNDLLQADRVHALLAEQARCRVQDPVACSGCGLSRHHQPPRPL